MQQDFSYPATAVDGGESEPYLLWFLGAQTD